MAERAVPDPVARRRVRGVEQCLLLGDGEVADDATIRPLQWNREDTADLFQRRGHTMLHIPHERLDGGQARVARARTVAPLLLQVGEEREDERRVEVLELEAGGRHTALLAREREEELKCVGVRVARLGARTAFDGKAHTEEGRDVRGERRHGVPPWT